MTWTTAATCLVSLLMLTCLCEGAPQNDEEAGTGGDPGTKVRHLADDFWAWQMEQFPNYALSNGDQQYAGKFQRLDVEVFREQKEKVVEFGHRADNIMGAVGDDKTNLELLKYIFQTFQDGYQYYKYGALNNINFMEGPHKYPNQWVRLMNFTTIEDYDLYTNKIKNLVVNIDETIDLMRKSMDFGTQNHKLSMKDVGGQIEDLRENVESGVLNQPYKNMVDNLADSNVPSNTLTLKATMGFISLNTELLPAFDKLQKFIKTEYKTRDEVGVNDLPEGYKYYRACLKWHLTVGMDPEDVHTTGLQEVERIKAEMQKLMGAAVFQGSIRNYIDYLNEDPDQFVETKEQMLEYLEELYHERLLPNLHKVIPNDKILTDIQIMESESSKDILGRYYPASPRTPAMFVANVHRPRKMPKYALTALAIHELIPGHHLAASYSQRADVPKFRRRADNMRYAAVPFHIPTFNSFSEGWSLYAETFLGHDMGVYKTDEEKFGALSNEILRAARLVVDTGIHIKGWTAQQAHEYLGEFVAWPHDDIRTEVNRYITWPGQACSYKIGELRIKKLRAIAQEKIGSKLDLPRFHDAMLSIGRVPLDLLDQLMMTWIEEESKRVATQAGGGHGGSQPGESREQGASGQMSLHTSSLLLTTTTVLLVTTTMWSDSQS